MKQHRSVFLARLLALLLAAFLLTAAASAPLRQVAILDLPGRPGFDEVALAHGMILVSHPGAGVVDLFDPQKRRIVGHISDMSSPRGVAVDEGSHLIYIANSGAHNLVVVSAVDWQVQRTVPLNAAPDALLLVPSEHHLYVSYPESRSIAVLDVDAGFQAVSQANLDGTPYGLAYDPGRHELFVSLQDRREIAVLSEVLKQVSQFSLNATEPTGIVFSPRFDRLFVAVRYAVLALDPATGTEVSRSAVDGGIDQLTLDEPTNSLLGVAHGAVFVLPASSGLGPASEMPLEIKGHTIAYDSATGFLYLPGGREGRSKLLILKRLIQKTAP